MTKHRVLLWVLSGVLMVSGAVPALAAPAPKEKAPAVGPRAGQISALLPVATVSRGSGKAAVKNEAKKGDELFWNDLVQTAKGGRARITLADQSILSLGSQAELRIVKHDARSQQTLLQMTYGRVRAEVSSITRDGGRFEVRTPTAVAGVIGTDFGEEAGVGSTTFVCISGAVSVANSDPTVPGSVQCGAGQTTTVDQGKAPTPPKPATPEQIQQLITDTEPANIGAMAPAAALPGATIEAANVTGAKLSGVNGVQITGSGVTASLNQGGSDTSLSLRIVVAANAAPGPHTITLTKASGVSSATVFTVLAPPDTAQNTSGDPKKPFHDTLDQIRQSGDGTLATIVATVQQLVDQATQSLTQANQNLSPQVDLTQANSGLNAQVTAVKNAVAQASTEIDQAAAGAGNTFDGAYTAAYNALLQRNAAGTPDDTFNQAVTAAFQQATGTLQQAILTAQSEVNSQLQTAGNQIGQVSQTWVNTITTTAQNQVVGPTPNVNGTEKSVDVGATLTLDASSSKAAAGASIVSYNWALCDAGYKPAQFGVPLQGNPPGCNAISGMTAASSDFTFPTCSLNPGDYIARVVATDTYQKQGSMDVKVHVLAPGYDDPPTVVRNLAQAYGNRNVSLFMGFFDDVNFPGYTSLSESIRQTIPLLASMNINVVIASSTINCNQADIRANWDQNYSFVSAPDFIQKQSEQLTLHLVRTPGKKWAITSFQGDNGTVQGSGQTLPGPTVTDQALPDIQVTAVGIPSAVNANGALNVASGNASFVATVVNTGAADLTANMPVHFSIRDASGVEVAAADQTIPAPLAATTGTTQMTVSMAVPNLQPGTPLTLVATANPGCAVQEKNCDSNDTQTLPFLVGVPLPDLRVTGISVSAGVQGSGVVVMIPGPQTFTVTVANAGNLALTAPTSVHFSLRNSANSEIASSDQQLSVPLNASTSTTVAATLNIPVAAAGAKYTMTATVNPGCTVQEIFCDSANAGTVNVAVGATSIKPGTVSLVSGGASQQLTVSVNGPASLTLVLPTSGGVLLDSTVSGNTLTQTTTGAGTMTWTLMANFTAQLGSNLTMAVADATGLLPNTPVLYSVTGQSNYIIVPNSITFGGKTGPFTGANALQFGTSPSVSAVVQNTGNLTQSGTINVSFSCAGPSNCNNPIVVSVPAPAAGQSVTATGTINNINNTPGTYTGTAALSTTLPQSSTADDSASTPFDVVDFSLISQNGTGQSLTLYLGGNFTLSALLTETGTTPFPLPITTALTTANVTLAAPTTATSGTVVNVGVTAPVTATPGPTILTVNGVNQGIAHGVTQAFNVVAPFVINTTPVLQSGSGSQPLTVQANTAGTLTLGTLPTGVTIDPQGACTTGAQTTPTASPTGAQTITWCLQASNSSGVGAFTTTLAMSGTSFNYSATVNLSVNGTPDYVVTAADFSISGHSGTFTGSDALQVGETPTATVLVHNNGNASPVGTITVSVQCGGPLAGTNCTTPNTTTVAAPAAGATATATIPLGTVNLTPGTGYGATITLSGGPAEINTNNDTASVPFDVTDFTLTFANGSPTITMILGGTSQMSTLLTVNGTSGFALPITASLANSPATFTLTAPPTLTSGSAQNVTVVSSFTSATGANTLTVSASNHGVLKTATQAYNVLAPITQTNTAPLLIAGGASQPIFFFANSDGTATLNLSNGISLDTTKSCNQSALTTPTANITFGNSTTIWCIQAASTGASTGGVSVSMVAGVNNLFAGTYTTTGNYALNTAPDYAIASTDFTFAGHNTPYTGANALQVGESFSINVVIHNNGSASPAGNITVHLTCTAPANVSSTTNCQGSPPDVIVPAPAVGATQTATFSGLNFNDPAGAASAYTGTVTITATDPSNNPIAELSTSNNTAQDTFDITDFQLTLPQTPTQPLGGLTPLNILFGGTGTFQVAATETGTTAYALTSSVSSPTPLTMFAPGTINTGAAPSNIQINTLGVNFNGGTTVTFSATNRGVTKTVTQPIAVLSEQIQLNGSSTGTSLYLNDSANPLSLPMGAPPITITLKLTGDAFSGNASISANQLNFLTSVPLQSTVTSGGTFDWQIGAQPGAATTVQTLPITVQYPQTNGTPNSVTFNLYIKPTSVPDLTVVGFTPPGAGGPFLSGQGVDFSVSINNLGGSNSAGGETITGKLNSADMGCTHPTLASLSPGIPTPTVVTVHCTIPDYHDQTFSNSSMPISFKIASDPVGDLNYANNTFSGTVPVANWHAVVSCAAAPCGASDAAPLTLTIFSGGPWSANSNITAAIDGGGSNSSTLAVANGAVASGLNLLSGAGTTTVGSFFSPTVSTSNGSLQNGFYVAQIVLGLTDATSGTTAYRQATIHVQVSNQNQASPGGTITFSSSAGNTSPTPGTVVQINGALTQKLTVTGNCSTCTNGGSYDFTVHDDPLTSTSVNNVTGSQSMSGVAFGTPILLSVAANQDASGNVPTGATSSYSVNATAAQLSKARGIAPDASGVSQTLLFQVGDFDISATGVNGNYCGNVPPGGSPLNLTVSFNGMGGFNATSATYQLTGSSPIQFGGATSGGLAYTAPATYSGNLSGVYAPLNFTLSMPGGTSVDGLQTYYLAVTITGQTSSATKYFPLYFDASTSQNYCGIVSGARGMTRIRGSWNKSLLGGGPAVVSSARTSKTSAAAALPDLRINAQDVSFTPSIPKAGDTVQVRFRVTNQGDGDARSVPIAIQVNGQIAATDTFDVPAGRTTLAGLEWTMSDVPSYGPRRPHTEMADMSDAPARPVSAYLVIDPGHTIQQKTQLQKTAALAHFTVTPGSGSGSTGVVMASAAGSQRIILEMEEGGCIGLHLSTGGTTSCGSADVEITVDDLAKGAYRLEALNGIGDLGQNLTPTVAVSGARLAGVRYSSQALGLAGHSYAVQLSGGRTGVLTVMSVRSPNQLDAKTRAIFRKNAARVLKGLGGDTEAPTTAGDISGNEQKAVVYFELMLQGN